MKGCSGLHAFQIFVDNTNIAQEKADETNEEILLSPDRFATLQRRIREREAKHGHDLDSLVPILENSSADLRAACEAAVKGVKEWFQGCNSGRWAGFFSKVNQSKNKERHNALITQLEAVERALEQFRQVERVRIVKPFERFFDPETGERLKSIAVDKDTEMFAARFDRFFVT